MRVAILQLNYIVGDFHGNANKILSAVRIAFAKNADLCITSELSLWGYPAGDGLQNPTYVQASLETLKALALNLSSLPPVIVGFAEPNPGLGKPLFNSVALLSQGNFHVVGRKCLLPTYGVFNETRYFESAQKSEIVNIKGKNCLITICEDLWFGNDVIKTEYRQDPFLDIQSDSVDYVINISASPVDPEIQTAREHLVRKISQKFQATVIYCNQVGGNTDLIFDGGSLCVDENKNYFYALPYYQEEVVVLEPEENEKIILPPHSSESLLAQALILGVHDYFHKSGFQKAVLGLSGGIDSALTAWIACQALGKENIVGVMLPSPYSSEASMSDAEELAQNLGIRTHVMPIEFVMNSFQQVFHASLEEKMAGIALENLQSRIRGSLLMAFSNQLNALVLNTGNKSELAVGYCTLYGDMNGALSVLGDLWKTQVFQMCRWVNQEKEIIPAQVISKPPSAELCYEQLDEDFLPPYEILDQILEKLVGNKLDLAGIVEQGFPQEVVSDVAKLFRNAEFKRSQAPPVLKVSCRSLGIGREIPLVNRYFRRKTENI